MPPTGSVLACVFAPNGVGPRVGPHVTSIRVCGRGSRRLRLGETGESYDPVLPPLGADPDPTVTAFDRALRVAGASAPTRRAYGAWLKRFFGFIDRDQRTDPDPYLISDFLVHCQRERHLGGASRRQALQALCAYYRLLLNSDPGPALAAWREPGARVPTTALAPEAVARLLAAIDQPLRLVAELIYGSGLRPGECLALRTGQIDLSRRRIADVGARHQRTVQLPQGLKSAVERQLELAAEAGSATTARIRRWLFPDPVAPHRHRPPRALQRAVAGAGRRRLGLAVSPYDLRHACAVHLLAAGTDPALVQQWLGLRDRHAVCAYRELLPAEGPQAISPFDRLPTLENAAPAS